MLSHSEASYPIEFRAKAAKELGDHLRHHHSVVLLGMKRVGISNFLRFFMSQPEVPDTYIKNGPLLWVQVDLNNLVELSLHAFWTLTLKRLVDSVEASQVSPAVKQKAERLFADSIQLSDTFFTLDCVQKLVTMVAAEGLFLVLVFMRFDRLSKGLTPELFANLQVIKDTGGPAVAYIFTSFRPLYELSPDVFTKSALSVFARDMYLLPAKDADVQMMLQTFSERYELKLTPKVSQLVIKLCGGHAQYLHLSLLKLKSLEKIPDNEPDLRKVLASDDEIKLLSEEILTSLTPVERQAVAHLHHHKKLTEIPDYLLATGLVTSEQRFFSPLFAEAVGPFVTQTAHGPVKDLTRKEQLLFDLLNSRFNEVVERDEIIEAVWPDQVELGVTDWALDRLVARLRNKLGTERYPYQVVTIISRGYKLTDWSIVT